MPKKKRVFYGWWMVLASAILSFFAGGTFYYGFTVFFNPIRHEFGWTAAITSIAFTLQRLEQGILGPVVGFLADRVSARKMMLLGWGVVGLGFFLMSRINALWAFYASFLLLASGISFGFYVVMNTTIARWFTKKRSRAITMVTVGAGASGLLVPLLAYFIGEYGWRESLMILGVVTWCLALPLCLVMRHEPRRYGYLPDGEKRAVIDQPTEQSDLQSLSGVTEPASGSAAIGFTVKAALRTRAFWLLAFVGFFQQIGTSAVMVHIVPYLESVEVSTTLAATAVAGMTVFSLLGRLGFGLLGDFANKRYLITIAIILQTIGLFAFSFVHMDRIWLLVLFLLTYAPGYGAPIPLRPALQADFFGIRSFGTIMGLMAVVGMLAGLASPVVAGWIFDVTGSYRSAWQIFALTIVPAIALMLLAKPPVAKQES